MFLVDLGPGVGLLGHRINTFRFNKLAKSFPKGLLQFTLPSAKYESCTLSLTFDITGVDPFTVHYFGWCIVVFHCGLNLCFSTD